MKFLKYVLLLLMALSMAFVIGCGSDPGKDDSDVEEEMKDVEDGVYYNLRHLVSSKEDEESGEIVYTYANKKFITHAKEISLKYNNEVRKTDAVMEYSEYEEEVKDVENQFYVVFDDGDISLITADANLLDDSVTSANILSEDILCLKELKQGMYWTSPNGYFSKVERYEYVVISSQTRSAPSYKIVTYSDATKSKKLRTVWWTPEIAWCCQWKDHKTNVMDTLNDLDYDWDED